MALVSYVPDPLGGFVDEMCVAVSGAHCPPAHVTLLPRRPLRGNVDGVSEQLRAVLGRFAPFEIELTGVCRFSTTDVIYLDIGEGTERLHQIHDALNIGELAHEEEFPFHPHLTIARPMPYLDINRLQRHVEAIWKVNPHSQRFTVSEAALVWIGPTGVDGDWRRLWTAPLKAQRHVASS